MEISKEQRRTLVQATIDAFLRDNFGYMEGTLEDGYHFDGGIHVPTLTDQILADLDAAQEYLSPDCGVCGTWRCDNCRWSRSNAKLGYRQQCSKCRGTVGTWFSNRHRSKTHHEDKK